MTTEQPPCIDVSAVANTQTELSEVPEASELEPIVDAQKLDAAIATAAPKRWDGLSLADAAASVQSKLEHALKVVQPKSAEGEVADGSDGAEEAMWKQATVTLARLNNMINILWPNDVCIDPTN